MSEAQLFLGYLNEAQIWVLIGLVGAVIVSGMLVYGIMAFATMRHVNNMRRHHDDIRSSINEGFGSHRHSGRS